MQRLNKLIIEHFSAGFYDLSMKLPLSASLQGTFVAIFSDGHTENFSGTE